MEKTLEELDAKLSGITQQEDVAADPEEVDLVETADEKAERERLNDVDDSDYVAVPETVVVTTVPPQARAR